MKRFLIKILPNQMVDFMYKLKHSRDYGVVLDYKASARSWEIKCANTWENRADKTCKLLVEALRNAKVQMNKDLKIRVCIGDYPLKNQRMMAYSNADFGKVISIPDFSFVDWKECGIDDYDGMCDKIYECSQIPPIYNQLFWIGNTGTHLSRVKLCEMSEKNPDINAIAMDWIRNEDGQKGTKFVSLPDHTQYKWLIDIQGSGWSARTKFLMFSGRTLFLVDRKWKEYWYSDIKPFVHYIPVREDLSDLEEKIKWVKEHETEANTIARNAQEYALNNLRKQNAVDYLANLLIMMSNGNM